MEISPLRKIEKWYSDLSPRVRSELASLSALFHPDKNMLNFSAKEKVEESFRKYLLEELDYTESVKRAIFIIGLVDLVMDGRGTKEDWEELMDRNLGIRSVELERGEIESVTDKFFENFERDKNEWIDCSGKWEGLKSDELRGKKLFDWWSTQFIGSRKRK